MGYLVDLLSQPIVQVGALTLPITVNFVKETIQTWSRALALRNMYGVTLLQEDGQQNENLCRLPGLFWVPCSGPYHPQPPESDLSFVGGGRSHMGSLQTELLFACPKIMAHEVWSRHYGKPSSRSAHLWPAVSSTHSSDSVAIAVSGSKIIVCLASLEAQPR